MQFSFLSAERKQFRGGTAGGDRQAIMRRGDGCACGLKNGGPRRDGGAPYDGEPPRDGEPGSAGMCGKIRVIHRGCRDSGDRGEALLGQQRCVGSRPPSMRNGRNGRIGTDGAERTERNGRTGVTSDGAANPASLRSPLSRNPLCITRCRPHSMAPPAGAPRPDLTVSLNALRFLFAGRRVAHPNAAQQDQAAVSIAQRPSPPVSHAIAPTRAAHSGSDPNSSRHDHRRRVDSCSAYSLVKPIAPWT